MPKLNYPTTTTVDVVDDYHGTPVADPYRWLEEADDPAVKAWSEAQSKLALDCLHALPGREALRKRLTQLWDYQRFAPPVRRGDRLFFQKNNGLQNQPVLYVQDGDAKPRTLLDPNTLSDDGTVALTGYVPNKEGSLIAYRLAESGSDRQVIHIRDVASGDDLDETIQWCRFAGIAWHGDGFFYNRYPADGDVPIEDMQAYNKVYWHALNTPQSEDVLIYERPDAKELNFTPTVTDDGIYLVLHVWHGAIARNRIYYRRLDSDGDFIRLIDEPTTEFNFIGNSGTTFYFVTKHNAPLGKVIAIDIEDPEPENWRDIVAQDDSDTLNTAYLINHHFVLLYMHDAYNHMKQYDLAGQPMKDIALPALGSVVAIEGEPDQADMHFLFTSYLYPPTVFRYTFATGSVARFGDNEVDFDPTAFQTTQVFFTSKDGTRVPMFITHKKGIALDGSNPTILYGYGGYSINLSPGYINWLPAWLEQGGVYVVANLRGGDEYGEGWHEGGMLSNKQNVFDDFIAAAEHLISEGYTSTPKLAIEGGSNGGLLVAACMVQRPDLYGAVLCHVPVIDMLRYHRFTAGRYWTPEYGNAEENPEHFAFIVAYSPLHNIKPGAPYPPILIMTADHDDRVVPMHSKKFAATLQAESDPNNLILLRLDMKAGHGLGKPTVKLIDQRVDVLAFLRHVLDMD